MGCASSCSIFEELSCALQWIAHTKGGITHIVHVLDDFLILNGQNKNVCNQNLKTFLKICNTVGVPIKEEKTAYAQTTMTCLGTFNGYNNWIQFFIGYGVVFYQIIP
jgi:hypothetical protein